MADNVAMYGFRPATGGLGFGQMGRTIHLPVASNYSSTTPVGTAGVGFRAGDVVVQLTDGTLQHCVVDSSPTVAEFSAPLGVVIAVAPWFDSTIGQNGAMRRADNLPTGVVYGTNLDRQSFLEILPIAGAEFEVDVSGGAATTLAAYQALVGSNCDLIYSAVAPKAFPRINLGANDTTARAFRIVRVSPTLNNQDFSGLNVKLIVTGNMVQSAPFQTTGI